MVKNPMTRRDFIKSSAFSSLGVGFSGAGILRDVRAKTDTGKIGIIGLDTSHSPAFAKYINNKDNGFRVTAAWTTVSKDIPASPNRVEKFTGQIRDMGIKITGSIEEMLEEVDYVLLETVDGRLHPEQAEKVFKSGKRVFIDKPVAGSLQDAVSIFAAAKKYNSPTFSSSGTRFISKVQAVRNGEIGQVLGADTFSPMKLEPTHPDLFWYGIHGVEILFTVMQPGCKRVRRVVTDTYEQVTGDWGDGRIGTFRGIKKGEKNYGGQAFGTEGLSYLGEWESYDAMLDVILHYFATGEVPVEPAETLEIYAFMEAAHESLRQGGAWVTLESVLKKAQYKG